MRSYQNLQKVAPKLVLCAHRCGLYLYNKFIMDNIYYLPSSKTASFVDY